MILTETKFKSNEMNTYKQDWNSGLLASCTSEPRAQAGVAILFRRGLAVDILSHGQDSNGKVVWALVEIYAKKFSLYTRSPPQARAIKLRIALDLVE